MAFSVPPIREVFTINGYIAPAWVLWFNQIARDIANSGGGGGGGGSTWGSITGTLSSQTDLQSALNGKAATVHTHTASQITDLSNNLRIFIQSTAPTGITGPYLWIDTTGGNLSFNVEDGL